MAKRSEDDCYVKLICLKTEKVSVWLLTSSVLSKLDRAMYPGMEFRRVG